MPRLLMPVLISLGGCVLVLGLAWYEASGVSFLFRQLDEDDDLGIRVNRKGSGSLQHILSGRFQLDLSTGFFSSMLDGGFRSCTVSRDIRVRMIRHVQGQFSVRGDQLEVIGPGSERLSAVEGRDRAGVLRLVGVDRQRSEE